MRNTIFTAVLLISLALATPSQAFGDSNRNDDLVRSVTVSGTCHRSIVPDKASLNMVAESVNPRDIKTAVADAVRNYESTKAQVTRLRLKDMELVTSEYNVNPIYDWNNGKQTLRGYQARIGLRVESSEIDRMGEVMGIAADNNMKDVGAWSLFVSPAKFKQVQSECLAEAAQDARSNAEKMASGLGAKVGAVIRLSQQGVQQAPQPLYASAMMERKGMAADAAAPSIEAGKQEINITVDATFLIQ